MAVVKVLVVGSGGREHALAWRLGQTAEVAVVPGNAGIADEFPTFAVAPREAAQAFGADLVVIGPEAPLIEGLADELRADGFLVFGPGIEGAQLEASKAFAKRAMREVGVPTAEGAVFDDLSEATLYAIESFDHGRPVVVKASGAALGKGVVVPDSLEEALDTLRRFFSGELGEAGRRVILERRLRGREFSLMTLVAGRSYFSLPVTQDYKRLGDGDTGPNTGGMGTYGPAPWVASDLIAETEEKMVVPILDWMSGHGIDYRGVLFTGVMVEDGRPYCLEYNVRFGDPETQSLVGLLEGDFAAVLADVAAGGRGFRMSVADRHAVTVVLASEGYPGAYPKGLPIDLGLDQPNTKVFHAGTKRDESGQLVTAGGRVLGVTGWGDTSAVARERAYLRAANVRFAGRQMRQDIAIDTLV